MLWLTDIVTQGFYNSMLPVAYPLTVIPNTLGMYLFNTGAKEGGGLTVSRVRHILVFSFLLQTVTTIGFLILVGPVVRFVYGDEFAPAVVFAMWLAPIAAIKGVVQGLESYVKGRGRPMSTIGLRAFSAVAMVVSTVVLYPYTNVMSIVQGSLVGQIVCVIGLALIVYSDARDNSQSLSTGESV
jgi:enterobacterial common antigen flippase